MSDNLSDQVTTYLNPDGSVRLAINSQTLLTFGSVRALRDFGEALVRFANNYVTQGNPDLPSGVTDIRAAGRRRVERGE